MIKFYLSLNAKTLSKRFLYSIPFLVVIFNIIIRLFPESFFQNYNTPELMMDGVTVIPRELFGYCDVFLLLTFIIIVTFSIGMDFDNSVADITLVAGGSRIHRFMLKKFVSLLVFYIPLYFITYINVYEIFYSRLIVKANALPFKQAILYSFSANFFIIALSLFLIFLTKDIAVTTVIITSFYLIEEYLWNAKITGEKGILGQLYEYYIPEQMNITPYKIMYIAAGILLLLLASRLSSKKNVFLSFRKR